jgi:hypothetical protein
MLKERTTSEKLKAQARQRHLDTREELLERQWAAINELDAASQEMMSDTKELYASAEAWANTTIKKEEELIVGVRAVVEQERAVEELEQKLQEREGLDDIKFDHELEALATCESSLDSHEATLEAEWKALEDAHLNVTARELVIDVRERNLNTKAVELMDREKWLAERQMRELTVAQKRLEELLTSQAGEARRVWDFLGQIEAAPVPLASALSALGSRHKRSTPYFHFLTLLEPRCPSWRRSSVVDWRRRVVP